jgi:hypothetical protein
LHSGSKPPHTIAYVDVASLLYHVTSRKAVHRISFAHRRMAEDLMLPTQGGGMNPFDMGKMMESVKKAQAIVQEESQKMQAELARCV